MPTPTDPEDFLPRRGRISEEFLVGAILYLVSFFFPAVAAGGMDGTLPGYVCAWLALCTPAFFLSGLINPLLVIYVSLVAMVRPQRNRLLRVVAAIIIALVLLTLVQLIATKVRLNVGFYTWAAGLLIMTVPRVFEALRKPSVVSRRA